MSTSTEIQLTPSRLSTRLITRLLQYFLQDSTDLLDLLQVDRPVRPHPSPHHHLPDGRLLPTCQATDGFSAFIHVCSNSCMATVVGCWLFQRTLFQRTHAAQDAPSSAARSRRRYVPPATNRPAAAAAVTVCPAGPPRSCACTSACIRTSYLLVIECPITRK